MYALEFFRKGHAAHPANLLSYGQENAKDCMSRHELIFD